MTTTEDFISDSDDGVEEKALEAMADALDIYLGDADPETRLELMLIAVQFLFQHVLKTTAEIALVDFNFQRVINAETEKLLTPAQKMALRTADIGMQTFLAQFCHSGRLEIYQYIARETEAWLAEEERAQIENLVGQEDADEQQNDS